GVAVDLSESGEISAGVDRYGGVVRGPRCGDEERTVLRGRERIPNGVAGNLAGRGLTSFEGRFDNGQAVAVGKGLGDDRGSGEVVVRGGLEGRSCRCLMGCDQRKQANS